MLDVSAGASRGSGDSWSKVRPAPGSLGCRTRLALRGSSVSSGCHNIGSVCGQAWQLSAKTKYLFDFRPWIGRLEPLCQMFWNKSDYNPKVKSAGATFALAGCQIRLNLSRSRDQRAFLVIPEVQSGTVGLQLKVNFYLHPLLLQRICASQLHNTSRPPPRG